jgi:hypothetical protein
MTLCKNCGKGIKWFKDPVNDKWIPLEADCNLEYESPDEVEMNEVLQWKHNGDCNAPESYLWWEAAGRNGFFYLIRISFAFHALDTPRSRR